MEAFVGRVWLNEDWEGESCRDFMEVSSISDCSDSLDERLIELKGKIVKITLEVID
ncbi:hypothetical protein [Planococcus versutus]|uniref:hypothetical protein n=1 Tax=Planococcus versutus TaxID=1302659 RepID=UPI0012FF6D1E|nr:hypothetical protein [Planococcus versutus]